MQHVPRPSVIVEQPRIRLARRLGRFVILIGAGLGRAAAGADDPAGPLLRLVPPEASMVLAVEDLRGRLKPVEDSKVTASLKQLPLVTRWLATDRPARYRRALRQIEAGLGLTFRAAVDQILGDAFVLVLQVAPAGMGRQSSGLLLIRPRDPKFLERLIEARNLAQIKAGTLVQVSPRKQWNVAYQSRLFRAGGWPSDHYVLFDDGTFAWSNSEAMIVEVIDRRGGVRAGWDSAPGFARVRAGLPARAVASLYLAPGFAREVLQPASGRRAWWFAGLQEIESSYLEATVAFGLAFEWRDGPTLHSHEVVDPARLPPWMAAWMRRPTRPNPLLDLAPPAAFGLVSARFDWVEVLRLVRARAAQDRRLPWETIEQAMQGLAFGEPIEGLLARVDPHLLVTLGGQPSGDSRSWFGLVAGIAWLPDAPWHAAANAARTAMAMHALQSTRRPLRPRVETRTINGRTVDRLGTPDRSFLATQGRPDRFLVGNTPEAIGQFAETTNGSLASSSLGRLRAAYGGDAETFAVVDTPGLIAAVEESRGAIVRHLADRTGRPITDVERDLNEFLALVGLFRAVVLTSKASPDATEVHRTFGLIAR